MVAVGKGHKQGNHHLPDCQCKFCMNVKDLVGKRFGRLLVLARDSSIKKPAWVCLCDCGGRKVVLAYNLLHGNTHSCGCLRAELRRVWRVGKTPPNRLPVGMAMRNVTLRTYKRSAEKRSGLFRTRGLTSWLASRAIIVGAPRWPVPPPPPDFQLMERCCPSITGGFFTMG